MIRILIDNPLLLLFLVAAVGYPLGKLRFRGTSLGVAAVLFVGLAAGSLHPDLKLPEMVYMLGLVLFVYSVGLASGPAFAASLRRDGVRNNLFALGVLSFALGLTMLARRLLQLDAPLTAGLFAGSLTNTPALASALETLRHLGGPGVAEHLKQPVVAYSVAYPVGVIGVVMAIALAQRLWKVDYAAEAHALRRYGGGSEPLESRTVRVTRPAAAGRTIEALRAAASADVAFGRVRRGEQALLADPSLVVAPGDLVTVIGRAEELARVVEALGEAAEERIDLDRSEFDMRRVFVSRGEVAGRRLGELELVRRFGAVVTRVRRGDDDLLPHDEMVLELGDRVRVVTRHDRMAEVSAFFGDSYRAVSEVDILTFSLGLALGLLLGILPVPLPGGAQLRLGFAGGPLVVALVLGTLGRTGPMGWSLPYSANLTIRQIGLVLFLAGIGTRAGDGFLSTFRGAGGLALFAAGAVITCATALAALWVGHRLLEIPMSLLIGMVAGLQTQPAVLGYTLEQTHNDLPSVGYASVYPVATIAKILFAQVLLLTAG